jgi:hypothetical protein
MLTQLRGRLVEAATASAEVRNIVLNVMFFFKKNATIDPQEEI